MILTAHQPGYLPWAGLFHKMALADLFCAYDMVKFDSRDFVNRNRIMTHNGPLMLTVPVKDAPRLRDVEIKGDRWIRQHLGAIQMAYGRAPYFQELFHGLSVTLNKRHRFLADLNMELLHLLANRLAIRTTMCRASVLGLEGAGNAGIVDMCRKLDATGLIFGAHGKDYVDRPLFSGVELGFQSFAAAPYRQLHGAHFTPNLSVIDLLFNVGPESLAVIMSINAKTFESFKETACTS